MFFWCIHMFCISFGTFSSFDPYVTLGRPRLWPFMCRGNGYKEKLISLVWTSTILWHCFRGKVHTQILTCTDTQTFPITALTLKSCCSSLSWSDYRAAPSSLSCSAPTGPANTHFKCENENVYMFRIFAFSPTQHLWHCVSVIFFGIKIHGYFYLFFVTGIYFPFVYSSFCSFPTSYVLILQ